MLARIYWPGSMDLIVPLTTPGPDWARRLLDVATVTVTAVSATCVVSAPCALFSARAREASSGPARSAGRLALPSSPRRAQRGRVGG